MKIVLILISCLFLIDARVTPPTICRNCRGKIHTREELELTKRPLLIDKNQTCHHERFNFLVIVKSGDSQRRNFTRHTWAKEVIEHFNIPVLYAIGSSRNSSVQEEIYREDQIYHDLLQFDILENYYNLTLKTISVLVWFDRYCSNSSLYLLYVDDDILIHVDQFIVYIHEKNYTNVIEGWFETLGKIQRTGIGGISKEDFPIDIVPDYLWGAAVLYPSAIISHVLIPSIFKTTLPIFFRDDVFINGFIAEEAGIQRQAMKGIALYDQTENVLKSHMIVIDFKNEEHRYRAWNCYQFNIQCNQNHILLVIAIVVIMGVILIIGHALWKYVRSTGFLQQLKYEYSLWYDEVIYSLRTNISSRMRWNRDQRSIFGRRLAMRWLMYVKRSSIRIVFLLLIFIVIYRIIKYS